MPCAAALAARVSISRWFSIQPPQCTTRAAQTLETLPENSRILISEGCTHHRQCNDIGTVKLPRWITAHTGKQFSFSFSSGNSDGIAGDTVHLANLQAGLEGVEEGGGRGFAGLQCHFLRDGAENDVVGNIDLRDLVAAHRDALKENAPMVIGGGAGGKAAVDLLDTVGHALDGLTIGDVLLDNFKTGLFIVNESDLGWR